jgi:hypothetical protein
VRGSADPHLHIAGFAERRVVMRRRRLIAAAMGMAAPLAVTARSGLRSR